MPPARRVFTQPPALAVFTTDNPSDCFADNAVIPTSKISAHLLPLTLDRTAFKCSGNAELYCRIARYKKTDHNTMELFRSRKIESRLNVDSENGPMMKITKTSLEQCALLKQEPQADFPVVPTPAGLVSDEGDEAGLRRILLKQLVNEDHFKRSDGLDVYVDDYSRPELLSREGLRTLEHARQWLAEEESSVTGQDGKGIDATCAS